MATKLRKHKFMQRQSYVHLDYLQISCSKMSCLRIRRKFHPLKIAKIQLTVHLLVHAFKRSGLSYIEKKMKTGTPSTNPGRELISTFIEVVHHCQRLQPCSWEYHFGFLQLQSCKQHPFQKAPFQKQHAFHPTCWKTWFRRENWEKM